MNSGGYRRGVGRPRVPIKRVGGTISLLPEQWARLNVLGRSKWIARKLNENTETSQSKGSVPNP
jgi:hypothetical protein